MMMMIGSVSCRTIFSSIYYIYLLSLKEAGRTSVLSTRWINLWKHTPSLDFDGEISFEAKLKESMGKGIPLEELEKLCKLPKSERRKYTEWVNSVIQSHKSPTLKQFRLRYALDTSDKNSITLWLQFASSRQVQSLVLHCRVYKIRHENYRFPEELFAPGSMAFDFKRLRELFFKHVNVSGGSIESFLRNCPLLEKLTVHSLGKLSKLEVCGSSLVLKHLEIVCFSSLGANNKGNANLEIYYLSQTWKQKLNYSMLFWAKSNVI